MKRSSSITGICALAALIGAPGCQADTEILVVITTDLQPPSSFSKVVVEVKDAKDPSKTNSGSHWIEGGPKSLEPGSTAIRLPAEQALVVPADPDRQFLITVTASKGDASLSTARVSKLVSPLSEGVAAVRFPLQFLCNNDLCREIEENHQDCCPIDQVCGSDGKCGDPDEVKLPPLHDPARVFGGGIGDGGGECFDAVGCFEGGGGPVFASLDELICRLTFSPAAHVKNVGLVTTRHGMCGLRGCYVPLDPEVWENPNSTEVTAIDLPKRVCDWHVGTTPNGVILGVVATTYDDPNCPRKWTPELPICSLASSTGGDTAYSVLIAKDEPHPVSIAVDGEDSVYWANTGFFNPTTSTFQNGSVIKHLSTDGYDVGEVLAPEQGASSSFRDIVVSGQNVLWTDSGAGKITCKAGDNIPFDVVVGVNQPEGIAVSGSTVFWTQLDGKIKKANVGDCSEEASTVDPVGAGILPFRIVASGPNACWTNEGATIGCSDQLIGTLPSAAPDIDTPRGIAVYQNPVGFPVFGAFAAFSSGTVFVVDLTNLGASSEKIPETFWITGQDHPSGVAVDEGYVYWTNWGDGTVKRASRHGCAPHPSTPELLAKGQHHPSGIVVTGTTIYWVNEGSSTASDGSVAGRMKPSPGAPSGACSAL